MDPSLIQKVKMRITPELRTKITEHFYYYRDDTQNESIIDESPKDINETSYYEQPYARDDLRTRIRDEIFYIDQAFLESESIGRVVVPRIIRDVLRRKKSPKPISETVKRGMGFNSTLFLLFKAFFNDQWLIGMEYYPGMLSSP